MKWALTAIPVLLVLGGCQNGQAAPTVTVTTTQAATAEPVESQMCANIRLQRDVNHTLAEGGYAEDYSDTYNQMLETQGCPTSSP